MAKALQSAADAVVFDLEDAVAPAAKAAARERLVEAVRAAPAADARPRLLVRVNPTDSALHEADLDAVAAVLPDLDALVLPKAESASEIDGLVQWVEHHGAEAGIVPVLETATGILRSAEVAHARGVRALIFGTLDLAADLGVQPTVDGVEFLHARSQLVLACRSGGLPGPLDGPHAALEDVDGLVASSKAVRALGFTGRVVIHPDQIGPVRDAFGPTDAEVARAQEIVAAFTRAQAEGRGAGRLSDGSLLERPVVVRAAQLLGMTPPLS
jgi:citrate lyase subunit beta/citryl-CoA lyase